jgi:Ca2+-binding EF-hand superfamily protein
MGSKPSRSSKSRPSLANLISSNNARHDEFELLSKSTPNLTRDQLESYYKYFLREYPKGYLKRKDFERLYKNLNENKSEQNDSTEFYKYVFKLVRFLFVKY